MTRYSRLFMSRQMTTPMDETQVRNYAGGFVFQVDPWTYLDRFLLIGTEGGTYYTSEVKLTVDNAKNTIACIKEDGERVLDRVLDFTNGRAVKNDACIFTLALCMKFGNDKTRHLAYNAMHQVCRTATHLFQLMADLKVIGKGWSYGLRRAVKNWYNKKGLDSAAYQITKYRNRAGYTHKDALLLGHVKGDTPERNYVYRYGANKADMKESVDLTLPNSLAGLRYLLALPKITLTDVVKAINDYNLTWEHIEAVDNSYLTEAPVWKACIPNMQLMAITRNLGRMTACKLLGEDEKSVEYIVGQLTNKEVVKKSRVHPIQFLLALRTYEQGHGMRGKMTWTPIKAINRAIEKAFYLGYDSVEATNTTRMLALDISGSMGSNAGGTPLSCREVTAALAMVTLVKEEMAFVKGFHHQFIDLNIDRKWKLNDTVEYIDNLGFGATDCSLPMVWALQNRVKVDSFEVYTDNETFAGNIHPMEALIQYRQKINPNAKLVVNAMTATNFSIVDPRDPGSLDAVGFDGSLPIVINQFLSGGKTQIINE